ncbi:hypothetical protein HN51_055244, partial [Arachis hypogaea]
IKNPKKNIFKNTEVREHQNAGHGKTGEEVALEPNSVVHGRTGAKEGGVRREWSRGGWSQSKLEKRMDGAHWNSDVQ